MHCVHDGYEPNPDTPRVKLYFTKAIISLDKFHICLLAQDAFKDARLEAARSFEKRRQSLLCVPAGVPEDKEEVRKLELAVKKRVRERRNGLSKDGYLFLKRHRNADKNNRKKLEGWFAQCSGLKNAHVFLQLVYVEWSLKLSPERAAKRFSKLVQSLLPERSQHCDQFIQDMIKYEKEAFGYFEIDLANGLVESIARRVRAFERDHSSATHSSATFDQLKVMVLDRYGTGRRGDRKIDTQAEQACSAVTRDGHNKQDPTRRFGRARHGHRRHWTLQLQDPGSPQMSFNFQRYDSSQVQLAGGDDEYDPRRRVHLLRDSFTGCARPGPCLTKLATTALARLISG